MTTPRSDAYEDARAEDRAGADAMPTPTAAERAETEREIALMLADEARQEGGDPWNDRLPRRDPETGFYDGDDDDLICERCGKVVTEFPTTSGLAMCAPCIVSAASEPLDDGQPLDDLEGDPEPWLTIAGSEDWRADAQRAGAIPFDEPRDDQSDEYEADPDADDGTCPHGVVVWRPGDCEQCDDEDAQADGPEVDDEPPPDVGPHPGAVIREWSE